jgi:hypothetical protein
MFKPDIPLYKIDAVNRAIDNPDKKMLALQKTGVIDPKFLDVFNLGRHGHRRYNHSIPSAFMAAYMVDPENAIELSMIHLMADRMGNYVHDTIGTDNKEIWEAMINKSYSMFKQTNGIKTRKQKRMYY